MKKLVSLAALGLALTLSGQAMANTKASHSMPKGHFSSKGIPHGLKVAFHKANYHGYKGLHNAYEHHHYKSRGC